MKIRLMRTFLSRKIPSEFKIKNLSSTEPSAEAGNILRELSRTDSVIRSRGGGRTLREGERSLGTSLRRFQRENMTT